MKYVYKNKITGKYHHYLADIDSKINAGQTDDLTKARLYEEHLISFYITFEDYFDEFIRVSYNDELQHIRKIKLEKLNEIHI